MSHNDTLLNKRKYPIQVSGYYIKEPEFGNLLREALKIGYYVFGYEISSKTNGDLKQREIEQAKNIKKILEQNLNAKILIHAGFDHIREDESFNNLGKSMAGFFRDFTGIDPLTIDQVEMSERSLPKYENPIYRRASVEEDKVYINNKGVSFVDKKSGKTFDIQIFHPKTEYIHSKPDLLFSSNRYYYQVIVDKNELTLPCFVFADNKEEFKAENLNDLIPVDIAEIDIANALDIGLALPSGEYILVFKDKLGKTLKKEINIK